ncbi:unnamed protein product [Amoebophrya sp. A25]|nr:unnamed protein product [Amoebophrya sp. A25]|eukprot:GSA25T00016221001.1
MVLCCPCGPMCLPLLLVFLQPLWNMLPEESVRKPILGFWNTRCYPFFVLPVVSKLPQWMQKWFGVVPSESKSGGGCCAKGACGDTKEVELMPTTDGGSSSGSDCCASPGKAKAS